MGSVASETTVECRSDQKTLWRSITDTERLNRAAGMGPISVRPLSDGSAARFLARTTISGFSVEFEERPFEWIFPEAFRVLRKARSGASTLIEMSFRMTPNAAGGTRVDVRVASTPRYAILGPVIKLVTWFNVRALAAAVRQVDEDLAGGGEGHPRLSARSVHDDALARAERTLLALGPDPLVPRLVRFVREADDIDLKSIRPFVLADAWGEDRRAVLVSCLAAVRAGLLELTWAVICPSCQAAVETLPTLAQLSDHNACQLCEIRFAVDLDDAVEAMFTPAPAVRAIAVGPYCIGGPALTPHVLTQAILAPRGEARLICPREEGFYRVFLRGGAHTSLTIALSGPTELRIVTTALGEAHPLTAAPGATLALENTSDNELHAKIERAAVIDQAATARAVFTLPEFRRDFSEDILRPGLALKVKRVGLFFSDLTGSTQLYNDAGDAAAFKLVQDHFDVVIALIEKHRGALIKTIGDAVMAAFDDDLDGLIAAVAILHAFEDFRGARAERQRTHIKLGVYGGPCYAVTANGALDYFGQTVNIAARLQGEAQGGELVVTADLAARAVAAGALPEAFIRARYEAHMKGVPEPIAVARVALPRG
jgi:adenylate cyclase